MSQMENYYQGWAGNNMPGPDTGTTISGYSSGYTCWVCGAWVNYGEYHSCGGNSYPYYIPHYIPYHVPDYISSPNKTEEAYRILKKLVELKTIPEPDSYKKFCDLIEAIKSVL